MPGEPPVPRAIDTWAQRALTLVNSIDVVVWEADASFSGFTFVSEQAERLLGYPIERWLTETDFWASHIHPADRDWCVTFCDAKTRAGEDHEFEYRMIAADGRTVWLRDIVNVVKEHGQPRILRGAMVNITDRKEAEDRLLKQEEQYRRIFNATSDGLVITDIATGIVRAANPAFCRMHGEKDMVGMVPEVFIAADSLHVFTEKTAAVQAGMDFRGRAEHRRRDGSRFFVEVLGTSFEFDGAPAVLGVVRDITEQVRSEQALERLVSERTRELERRRAVAEGLKDLLAIVNSGKPLDDIMDAVVKQARALLGSDAAQVFFPLPDADDFLAGHASSGMPFTHLAARLSVGTSAVGLCYSQAKPVLVPDILAAYEASGDSQTIGWRAVHEHIEVHSLPLPPREEDAERSRTFRVTFGGFLALPLKAGDQTLGVLALSYKDRQSLSDDDIDLALGFATQAALGIENARLGDQTQQLVAAGERQRLAHDLHDSVAQVLYGIALGASTAKRHLAKDPSLIADPLDYIVSLSEAGLAEMRALIFDLQPDSIADEGLLKALQRQVAVMEMRHGLAVEFHLGEEPPISLDLKESLYWVIRESLHNVVKHAQASSVAIRLSCSRDAVNFEVTDNGTGFDVDGDFAGHLGLHSMRRRVERFGGILTVSSSPNEGTRVGGWFPI
jgi:PAS domain S-box-containing protein